MISYNAICSSYQYDITNKVCKIITIININGMLIIESYYDHKGRLKEIKSSNGHHYIIKHRVFKKKVIKV